MSSTSSAVSVMWKMSEEAIGGLVNMRKEEVSECDEECCTELCDAARYHP